MIGANHPTRDLKQARTPTAGNKMYNYILELKTNHTQRTTSTYCIFEAYFMIKSLWKNCVESQS